MKSRENDSQASRNEQATHDSERPARASDPATRGDTLRAYLAGIVHNLPDAPGCYQYLDENGTIIYVGKAKNLKNRVSSYFQKNQTSRKTQLLVTKIRDIRYVVVKSETDALLLENNLIKRYKPRYNVLLKDDKTYPSIAVTNEWLPRIFKTRQRTLKGATYYGPYSHVPTMYALLDLCKKLYHPRPCRQLMSRESVESGKFDVCLEYHIHNCQAPCTGRQSREDYLRDIEACREILRGNTAEVARRMKEDMLRLSEELRFEEAQELKEKLELIAGFQARSEVVSNAVHDVDVFNIESDEKTAYINYLHINGGCINQAFTFEYRKRLDESDEELLKLGIVEMRERYGSRSPEIVVPFHVELPEEMARQTVPKAGEKKKLLELSRLNVKQYKFDRLKQAEKLNPEQKSVRLMKEIQAALGLEKMPYRIELFDNSNIQGADAVAACVVFEKMKPAKSLYRKYLIKTVAGPDDYASMQEVARRRYGRMKAEGEALPDLIIADGGKGQMEMLREVVEDELGLSIPIAGLAKDSRHRTREMLFGFPPSSVGMKADSPLFLLLTRMQDEVHRFAISFHREKRSQRQRASELDLLPGVGEKRKTVLLKAFGSVKRVKEADLPALQSAVGPALGEKLYNLFHAEEGETE